MRSTKPRPLDGPTVREQDVWVVVGNSDEVLSMLLDDDCDTPLTLCRGFVDADHLLIGDSDPLRDRLISNLLGESAQDLL